MAGIVIIHIAVITPLHQRVHNTLEIGQKIGVGFYETLSKKGYSVVGDPSDLFNQKKFANSAEFLIGRIVKMSGNFCEEHHWWDGRPKQVQWRNLY